MSTPADLAGVDLGARDVAYEPRDAILYALAVGAPPERLDLVYERDLRVLPTLLAALGLWAVEAAGSLGAYDRERSLHVGQQLRVHRPLAPRERIATRARVQSVWDKGKAAVVEIRVESDAFTAGYTIFLPGLGGWGGDRGPSQPRDELAPTWHGTVATTENQAALYRLTGDRHPIHIDPETAAANGFDRPILHGLCTLGIAARATADAVGAHPADLRELDCRLTAVVFPGDRIELAGAPTGEGGVRFEARAGDGVALSGRAAFGTPGE